MIKVLEQRELLYTTIIKWIYDEIDNNIEQIGICGELVINISITTQFILAHKFCG